MCSYAVGNSVLQLLFAFGVLCIGGAAEDMLPKVAGVGFPVLLSAVLVNATRRQPVPAVLFAVAAGAVEDSLSSLPLMTSPSVFVLAVAWMRASGMSRATALLAYPAYQAMLPIWTGGFGANMYMRILVALPVGALTLFMVCLAMVLAERRAAIGEQG